MFWAKNKKNRYTSVCPSLLLQYIKVGFKGVFVAWTCFPDVYNLVLQYLPVKYLNTIFNSDYKNGRLKDEFSLALL